MPGWYIAALFYQSAVQSALFALYLRAKRPWRQFLVLWIAFVGVIFPIDLRLAEMDLIIKNLFNCVFLGVLCRFLFWQETTRRIVFAVLLYETALVLVEICGIPMLYLLTRKTTDFSAFDNVQKIMTWIACGWMTLIVFALLQIFSKTLTASTKMITYLGCLLLNNIVLVLCVCQLLGTRRDDFFSVSYPFVVAILLVLNVLTLFSLSRFARLERLRQSQLRLETIYHGQLLFYLNNESSKDGWRRLRHDLLNFLEQDNE